ncbi:hypothetical protein THAOC_13054 [Thalassiosira oceanica]|uniref:Uncharacterized protein n=1 Tax=Thalassiosira oceanica TaxID=159749 RepID=K0T6I1_THAOC|nr:hypothetical protein THAOC_13054 [Thalassiosira oceanica]|eukprot:EJK66047.1 hypothetical protein THAOC_13054 [Thalassiosira oceanica]
MSIRMNVCCIASKKHKSKYTGDEAELDDAKAKHAAELDTAKAKQHAAELDDAKRPNKQLMLSHAYGVVRPLPVTDTKVGPRARLSGTPRRNDAPRQASTTTQCPSSLANGISSLQRDGVLRQVSDVPITPSCDRSPCFCVAVGPRHGSAGPPTTASQPVPLALSPLRGGRRQSTPASRSRYRLTLEPKPAQCLARVVEPPAVQEMNGSSSLFASRPSMTRRDLDPVCVSSTATLGRLPDAFPFPRVKTEGYRGLTSLNGAVKFVRQRSNRVKGAKGKGSASATFLVLMKSLSGDASRRASRRLLGAALTNQSSSDRV